jgi:hypothetical protein
MNRAWAGDNALKSLGLTRNGVSDVFSVLLDDLIPPLPTRWALSVAWPACQVGVGTHQKGGSLKRFLV